MTDFAALVEAIERDRESGWYGIDSRYTRLPDLETAFLELWARVQELEEGRASAMLRRHMRAPEDPQIEALCERFGYGAVMDAASRLWARGDSLGAFFIGGCIGLRSDDEARSLLPQPPETTDDHD